MKLIYLKKRDSIVWFKVKILYWLGYWNFEYIQLEFSSDDYSKKEVYKIVEVLLQEMDSKFRR